MSIYSGRNSILRLILLKCYIIILRGGDIIARLTPYPLIDTSSYITWLLLGPCIDLGAFG
jgi:hypothetical protein